MNCPGLEDLTARSQHRTFVSSALKCDCRSQRSTSVAKGGHFSPQILQRLTTFADGGLPDVRCSGRDERDIFDSVSHRGEETQLAIVCIEKESENYHHQISQCNIVFCARTRVYLSAKASSGPSASCNCFQHCSETGCLAVVKEKL